MASVQAQDMHANVNAQASTTSRCLRNASYLYVRSATQSGRYDAFPVWLSTNE
jgi:hypothetical protein